MAHFVIMTKMKFLNFIKNNKEIITLITLPIIFFHQIIFAQNKVLFNMASDIPLYIIREKFLVGAIHAIGSIPLWSNYMFSGGPFLADPSSEIFYPFNLLYFLFPIGKTFGYLFIIDFILLGIFTYLFCRLIKLSKFSSLISAVICIFGEIFMMQIFSGHIDILNTVIWLPALFYIFEFAIQKHKLSVVFISIFIAVLMVFAGFIQIIAYIFISSFIYFFVRLIHEHKINLFEKIKLFSVPVITFSVGILLSFVQLLPSLELAGLSIRHSGIDFKYASDFALLPYQIISAILPNFFGSQLDNTWWAKGSMETGSIYMGIFALCFVVLALFKVRNKYIIPFFLILLLALIYAFGSKGGLFGIFYNFVPGFKSFRAPGRALFIYGFAFSILAGFGLDYLLSKIQTFKLNMKKIVIFSGYFLFILLLLVATITPAGFYFYDHFVLAHRFAIDQNHLLIYSRAKIDIYLISFLTLSFLLILILKIHKKINVNQFKILLLVLIIFELWFFDYPYLKTTTTDKVWQIPAAVSYIDNDKSTFRIFDLTGKSIFLTSELGLETLTGDNSTRLYSYQNFLWQSGPHENIPYEPFFLFNGLNNLNVLRLLNVKYVISDNDIPISGLTKVYEKDGYKVFKLDQTLPRAFFIPGLKPEGLIDNLNNINVIKIKKYLPNQIDFSLKSSQSGVAVLSEIWYPGWKVYDNGVEKKLLKTDNIFRSVYLEKGSHNINFIFDPVSLKFGALITFGTLFIVLTSFAWFFRKHFRLSTFFRKP